MSSEKTTNLEMHRWNGTDYLSRAEFNENFEKIDSEFSSVSSQLSDISSDDTFLYNHFLSHMASYIGVINTGYIADDGTRFYILPKDYVTTGTGGAIKIFGDPYHLDQTKYRDLGVYFSQDQNSDMGYNGKGCFYVNVKVAGTDYSNKHPDIVFSFQDGLTIGGRFVRLNNGYGTYACQIIGSGNIEFADKDGSIRGEVHGSLGFRNGGYGIKFLNQAGTTMNGMVSYTTSNRLRYDSFAGHDVFIDNVKTIEVNSTNTKFNTTIVANTKYIANVSGVTTFDVTTYNRIQFAQSSPTTVTNFTGIDGQQLTILFSNTNTTLQNNTNLRLAGGVNFVGSQYAMLTLENWGSGVWYEKSRSINHA